MFLRIPRMVTLSIITALGLICILIAVDAEASYYYERGKKVYYDHQGTSQPKISNPAVQQRIQELSQSNLRKLSSTSSIRKSKGGNMVAKTVQNPYTRKAEVRFVRM